jgi:murein L,D-transpeptidase YcbB/YkuD
VAIVAARAHGLDPRAFAPRPGPAVLPDEACTLAALALARALSSGLVDPHQVEEVFTLRRNRADLDTGLARAVAQGKVAAWLTSLAPADPEYKALSAAYQAAFAQAAKAPPPPAVPTGDQAVAPVDQAQQLAVNLERRRWLDREQPPHRIDVNTAGAELAYLRPGAPTWWTRVVCGRPDHPTPCLEASFHKLIVNPQWRVPTEIAAREILPKGRRYLASQRMHWVGGRLEQAPGRKCALGRVKFDVEDQQDIYLHDTPDKWLFRLPDRHRSHGCVRVDGAIDFARGVAAETGKQDAFDQARATLHTVDIDLEQTIPVRLLYHTAYLDSAGKVVLAPDLYGADDRLSTALGLGQAPALKRENSEVLFGP